VLSKDNNSAFTKFLIRLGRFTQETLKKHLNYYTISLILVVCLYNILLYNLKILEMSWDGAAHASNGIILHDMIRDVIIRDHNFSPFALYDYILKFNLEWYASLGGSIAHYGLFVPFLFMLSYFILGISYSSAYLVIIIMGNICILTTFFLGAELFDRRIGLLAALFLAFSSVFFAFSKTALLDIPATTIFTLSIYSLILTKKKLKKKQDPKKQSFLTGLLVGLAFMTKPTSILLLLVISLAFILNYAHIIKDRGLLECCQKLIKTLKSNLWIFYGIIPALLLISFQAGIIIFSGSIKIWLAYGTNEPQTFLVTVQGWLFYIIRIGLTIPELGGVLIGLCYAIYRRTKKDKLLLSWYFVIYIIFSFIQDREARYFLLAFPVIFLLSARALIKIHDRVKKYRPSTVNVGTIVVIAIIFLVGLVNTLQHPYPYFYNPQMPTSETVMEDAAIFLVENKAKTMQLTLNPTISPSAMTFYILKHDREHETRYFDVLWTTRGELTVDEFRDFIKQLNISHLLISDPGNIPMYENLDKYVNYILENPKEFSLVRIFQGEYSIYIYNVQ